MGRHSPGCGELPEQGLAAEARSCAWFCALHASPSPPSAQGLAPPCGTSWGYSIPRGSCTACPGWSGDAGQGGSGAGGTACCPRPLMLWQRGRSGEAPALPGAAVVMLAELGPAPCLASVPRAGGCRSRQDFVCVVPHPVRLWGSGGLGSPSALSYGAGRGAPSCPRPLPTSLGRAHLSPPQLGVRGSPTGQGVGGPSPLAGCCVSGGALPGA